MAMTDHDADSDVIPATPPPVNSRSSAERRVFDTICLSDDDEDVPARGFTAQTPAIGSAESAVQAHEGQTEGPMQQEDLRLPSLPARSPPPTHQSQGLPSPPGIPSPRDARQLSASQPAASPSTVVAPTPVAVTSDPSRLESLPAQLNPPSLDDLGAPDELDFLATPPLPAATPPALPPPNESRNLPQTQATRKRTSFGPRRDTPDSDYPAAEAQASAPHEVLDGRPTQQQQKDGSVGEVASTEDGQSRQDDGHLVANVEADQNTESGTTHAEPLAEADSAEGSAEPTTFAAVGQAIQTRAVADDVAVKMNPASTQGANGSSRGDDSMYAGLEATGDSSMTVRKPHDTAAAEQGGIGGEDAVVAEKLPAAPRPSTPRQSQIDTTDAMDIDVAVPEREATPTEVPRSPAQHTRNLAGLSAEVSADVTAAVQDDVSHAIPAELLRPSPPRRNLRSRKPDQLHPYTVEMALYKRRLEKNDWEDAVVWDRELRRRLREEQERAQANDLPLDQSTELPRPPKPSRKRGRSEQSAQPFEGTAASPAPASPSRKRPAKTKFSGAVDDASKKGRSSRSSKSGNAGNTANKRTSVAIDSGLSDSDEEAAPELQPGPSRVAASSRRTTQRYGGTRRGRQDPRRVSDQGATGQQRESSDSDGPLRPDRKRRPVRVSSSSSTVEVLSSADSSEAEPGRDSARPSASQAGDNSDVSSSEESVDYDRYFRQLKRMMPVHMARKHIDDLKNMRRGKAYHSDGHVSATPEPSDSEPDTPRASRGASNAAQSASPHTTELQPGEARKRSAGQARNVPLVSESDMDSSEEESLQTVSSSEDEPSPMVDADIRWWARPEAANAPRRRRDEDEFDRMLSRSSNVKTASKRRSGNRTRRSGAGATSRRTSSSTARQRGEAISPAERRRTEGTGGTSKPRKHRPRGTGSSRPSYSSHRAPSGPRRLGSNPPVVQPRERRRLDLGADEVLFDVAAPSLENAGSKEDDPAQQGPAESQYALNRLHRPAANRRGPNDAVHIVMPEGGGASHSPQTPIGGRVAFGSPSLRQQSFENRGHESPGRAGAMGPAAGAASRSPLPNTSNGAGARSRTHQPRLDSMRSWQRTTSDQSANILSSQQLDANAWAELANLRIDFGIQPLPAGVSFPPRSHIGMGRLHELLELGKDEVQQRPVISSRLRSLHAFGLDLPAQPDAKSFISSLPAVFDGIYTATDDIATSSASDEGAMTCSRARSSIDDTLRYLTLNTSALLPGLPRAEARKLVLTLQSQLSRLFERFQGSGIGADTGGDSASPRISSLMLTLRWFNIEIYWRSMSLTPSPSASASLGDNDTIDDAEEFFVACQGLMQCLLAYGLHRAIRGVKRFVSAPAPAPPDEEGATPHRHAMEETAAEMWVNLIHLLPAAASIVGPHLDFWPTFDAALASFRATLPPRRKVLNAEMIWYVLFSVYALSQFSPATGTAASSRSLGANWSLVASALSAVRLRYDESVERSMPSAAIGRRDQYIRVVVQRCFRLATVWQWPMQSAEAALSKIFDVFNEHKLANLPSEEDHDFPLFLRRFDGNLLFEDYERNSTVYYLFLQMLARAGKDLRETAKDERDGDRRVARLFSRMSPVRVMPFSVAQPPTSRERSSLFNHYAVVMTHLFLVPSAAAQRLRQIKSFLVFKDADAQSQVACIRAMLYAAAIHRHYDLDIAPITEWFSSIFQMLLGEAEQLARKASGSAGGATAPGEHFATQRRSRNIASLLITSLRCIQHVIEHPSLDPDRPLSSCSFPDYRLLGRAWIADILETQTAASDPAIGIEVLKCVQAYLLQRNLLIEANRPLAARAQRNTVADEDSQDSFAGEFDDGLFFDHPALEDVGAVAAGHTQEEDPEARWQRLVQADRVFAEHVKESISPSLFHLLSNIYHPDRSSEARRASLGVSVSVNDGVNVNVTAGTRHDSRRAQLDELVQRSARRRYVELLIDCWAGCAYVLVRNGLRDWTAYLFYGNESWRRVGGAHDAVGRRDVGLRFLQNVAALERGAGGGAGRSGDADADADGAAGTSAYAAYTAEFLQMWFQAAGARVLSCQGDFTSTLFGAAESGVDAGMPWFRGCCGAGGGSGESTSTSTSMTADEFSAARGSILARAVRGMRRDYEGRRGGDEGDGGEDDDDGDEAQRAKRRGMIFSCLSAFLSSLRAELEEVASLSLARAPSRATEAYLQFCSQALRIIAGGHGGGGGGGGGSGGGGGGSGANAENEPYNPGAGEKILRGVRAELERTRTKLEGVRRACGSGASS